MKREAKIKLTEADKAAAKRSWLDSNTGVVKPDGSL